MSKLTLFVPGLLGLVRELAPEDLPEVPSIKYFFSRGSFHGRPSASFTDTLCLLFNSQASGERDAPIAAISQLVDDKQAGQEIWMRADPVHLAADREGVVLMDETSFTLDQHDALVLAGDIKDILADSGLMLEVPTTSRWYVKLSEQPDIKTTPVHEVVGKDIHQFMPAGNDRQKWVRLLNEIQMTLHASKLNEDRQQRGELPVNSVWFWGAGALPGKTSHNWTRVFTDDVNTQGFAIHTDTRCDALPDHANQLIEQLADKDRALVVMSFGLRHAQYHDVEGWIDFINYLDEFWFADLLKYLKSGDLEELNIISKKRLIKFNKNSCYKFWKRPKALSNF